MKLIAYTDPACPISWGAEPELRRLQVEFGDQVRITYVMAGLAREIDDPLAMGRRWLDVVAERGMPCDPRLWLDAPLRSTYPACIAVKAAAEQGLDAPYLRVVREGIAFGRRRLDNAEALVAAAREVSGMNADRFAVDLASSAIVEAFGADLERTRAAGAESGTLELDGERATPGELRARVLAAGARPQPLPSPEEALQRFGHMGTPEVSEVCDLPGPRASSELWRLALEWRARHQRVVCGELWGKAAA
jgi:predicted DsbA family dithiol-disulfide isomerase